jgi:hypothetical protein
MMKISKKANGTNTLNVILIVINIILLAAVIMIWANSGKESAESQAIGTLEVGTEEQAAATALKADVKLCSSIDDEYNCEESSTFRMNRAVYMLFSISGFGNIETDEGMLTAITTDVETRDSRGNIIEGMTGLLFDASVYNSTEKTLRFSEFLPTLLKITAPGTYTVKFEITDMVTEEKITKTLSFEAVR